MNKSFVVTTLIFLSFVGVSKELFDLIFATADNVIDEYFHIPQGIAYCEGNFSRWDPKITTLPGLYLVSTVLLLPFQACSTYWLRFVNLLASFINIILFIKLNSKSNQNVDKITYKNIWTGFNLALLPPLYFFSHFYYTDVLSVTSVLLTLLAFKSQSHVRAGITGNFSVLMRQTNIVWVGMLLGNIAIDIFMYVNNQRTKIKSRLKKVESCQIVYNYNDFMRAMKKFIKDRFPIKSLFVPQIINVFSYLWVIMIFSIFIYINGSIVVGDKKAHEATLHVPQLFYFSLFYLIFAPHLAIPKIVPFVHFTIRNKLVTLIAIAAICAIVHVNTIVHPYLLADNRHYTFYIWNRLYGKYFLFKYGMVVCYAFGIFAFAHDVYINNNFGWFLTFLPCLAIPLVLQKMLEVRYFLLPFILMRVTVKNVTNRQLLIETFLYVTINALTFYIFFTKEITWKDFNYTQRLIW